MASRVSRLISRVQRDAINAAVSRALASLAVEVRQSLPDWADENFYLSPESSGVQGPWETQPPQRGLMLVICNDDVKEVTVRKCARIGYTKILMATVAYYTGHIPRNGVLYQPTDGDSDDFVQTEVDPMIRDVAKVRDRMKGDPEKRSKGNTLQLKQFDSCSWHFRGGKAAAAYRRLTKDLVIYDELDGFDRDIEGTGDPVTLGDKRVTASPFKKSIRGSTPEDRSTSIIQATLETARLVFAWHFACIHCRSFVEFKWAHLRWDDRDSEPYGGCAACGGIWTYRDLRELNGGGRWQTVAEPIVYVDDDGQFRDAGDLLIDSPSHVGFTMWSGWSPFITWRELRDEFLTAKGSPLKLKGFVNTRLGECWEEGDRPSWEQLLARREHYPLELEKRIGLVTIGVDVQDDRFEFQVTAWLDGEESYSLGYGRLFVKTDTPEAFTRLYDQLHRPVKLATRVFQPIVCIDSGHRADDVYRICRRNPREWIPVKGSSEARAPYVQFPRTRGQRHKTYLTMLGVSNIKSLLYSRFLLTEGEGRYHWPIGEDHGEQYFQQLVSEEKRVKYTKGHPVTEWWLPGGVGNEVLDCNVYAYAAMRIAVDYLGRELAPREVSVETAQPAAESGWLKLRSEGAWLRGR
jgi:terminase, large subunit